MKTALNYLLILCCTLLLPACGDDSNPQFRLTSRERAMVDTLYSRQNDSLRLLMDSLCVSEHDLLLQQAVDSLLLSRKADEAKLRDRILKQQR